MGSQKCIWMIAGAVEYQLCPLNQNCDLCDFHKEMIRGCRTHSSQSDAATLMLRYPDESVVQFRPGLQYLAGHFWYQRVASGRIRLGIDAFLWQLFSSIHKMVIPKTKIILGQDQCFSWLLLGSGIIYLKTPIPGQIVEINPLFQSEDILGSQLYLNKESDLWIMELEETVLTEHQSLSKEQYLNQVKEDTNRFRKLIQSDEHYDSASLSRTFLINKYEVSKYLQAISDNHAFVC